MALIYCRNCGAQMHDAALACPACGSPGDIAARQAGRDGGYFSFQGRIGRQVFWLNYALPLAAAQFGAGFIDGMIGGRGGLSAIVALVCLVPNLASQVKRLHDRDKSGWFLLISLIPLIGAIWLLIEIGFLRGTEGGNRFGGDPLR